jgi:hypothetical protein
MEPNTTPLSPAPEAPAPAAATPPPASVIPPSPVITPPPAPKARGSIGGMIAILIILIAVVVGALYVWGERISKMPQTAEQEIESLDAQGDSTEPADIKADLEAESPDSFDADFDAAFDDLDKAFDEQ